MEELGSYPRMQYHDNSNFSQNPDQNGSWFNLAISGLKFLISNQSNDNINHNLNNSQSTTNSTTNTNPSNTKQQVHADHKHKHKIHLLGPSVFKKQLYDIPEYQSMQIKGNNKSKILTQQALKQFNGNFSNYWNQRSSLHSHHSSDHGSDNYSAGGSYTSQPNTNTPITNTDGAGSTIHQQNEEYKPFMTSSQIIHPTQDSKMSMKRSRSWPLLHSAEYIQNFEQFSRDVLVPYDEEEGSQCNVLIIPSPPPISNTPENNNININMLLPNIKNINALKSWDSIKSIKSIKSIHSSNIGSDSNDDNMVFIDHHFIKQKKLALQKQRQWLKNNVSKFPQDIKSRKSYTIDVNDTNSSSMHIVHVNHDSKSPSELDWTDCNETIKVISCPLPKSIKKNKRKKNKRKSIDNEEDIVFSDWSNVSSNIGVTTPQLTPH